MHRSCIIQIFAGLAVLVLGAGRATSDDQTWTNGAGGFSWSNSVADYWTPIGAWNNANVDDAIFGSTGVGAVTLGSAITLRGIAFNANANGYTINGSGANILTLTAGTTGSLQNGQVQVAGAVTAVINASLAGTVGLTQTGIGTLIFEGTNTYTGGTTVSGGTLQIGAGGTTGTLPGNTTDNAALRFNLSSTYTYSGAISGTGSVTQAGAGTTILTGANSYTGGTTVSNGTLQIGNGGADAGVLPGNVINNGAVVFNHSDTFTYGASITGTGQVTLAGTGTLVVTGSIGVGGITINSGSSLRVGDGGTSGTVSTSGAFVDNGDYVFNFFNTAGFSGPISGTGTLTQAGTGTLTAFGTSTAYTGGTFISTGTLTLGNSGALPTGGPVTVISGTLDLKSYSQTIGALNFELSSIAAAIVKTETGTLTLGGNVTLDNSGIGASISGNINLGGATRTVNINHLSENQYDMVIGAVIGGTGGLTLASPVGGSLALMAANTYNGATTISGGNLYIGTNNSLPTGTALTVNGSFHMNPSGSIVGNYNQTVTSLAGAGFVFLGSATLTVSGGSSTTFSGQITGTGNLVLGGSGTLTLSGPNTYTGGTIINLGTLVAGNGSGSATGVGRVTVANGGALAGGNGGTSFADSTQGFLGGAVTVQSDGALSPGVNGVGLLSAGGSVILQAGSIWTVGLATHNARPGAAPADANTNGRLLSPLDILFGSNLIMPINGEGQSFTDGSTYDYFIGQDDGAVSGLPVSVTFEPMNFASPVFPSEFALSRSANGLDIILTFAPVPVPEPGSLALVGVAATAAGCWRRKGRVKP